MDKIMIILMGVILVCVLIMANSIFTGLNDGRVQTVVKQIVGR